MSADPRSASDLGFDLTLVTDAAAAFARRGDDGKHYSGAQFQQANLVSLDGEFCRLGNTVQILEALAERPTGDSDGSGIR